MNGESAMVPLKGCGGADRHIERPVRVAVASDGLVEVAVTIARFARIQMPFTLQCLAGMELEDSQGVAFSVRVRRHL